MKEREREREREVTRGERKSLREWVSESEKERKRLEGCLIVFWRFMALLIATPGTPAQGLRRRCRRRRRRRSASRAPPRRRKEPNSFFKKRFSLNSPWRCINQEWSGKNVESERAEDFLATLNNGERS